MLEVRDLSKTFTMHVREGLLLPSFNGVSLAASAGEMLAITGPSGIGKSSLLKCIYRTYLPTTGAIIYRSKRAEIHDLAKTDEQTIMRLRSEEIGYISQFFHVLPRVSALNVLVEVLLQKGQERREAEENAKDLLRFVGLGKELWEMYPSTFSGGEKQRLNILRALISKPRLLLLDEPTASLDIGYKARVMQLILELKHSGTCMLGVFHDRDAMLHLADKRYDLHHKMYCAVAAD